MLMNNDLRLTDLIKADQIGSVAAELEQFAATLRRCEEVAKNQPEQALAIYYWTSAETGLKRISSFVRAADESRRQAILGKPLIAGMPKPRSERSKAKQDAQKALLAHSKEVLKAHQDAAKATKKKPKTKE